MIDCLGFYAVSAIYQSLLWYNMISRKFIDIWLKSQSMHVSIMVDFLMVLQTTCLVFVKSSRIWLVFFPVCMLSNSTCLNWCFFNKDCPDGWQHNNHSCYKIFTNDVGITWPEANRKCNQQNGSLVSIASKQELEYVHYLVTNSLDMIWDEQMWTGFNFT